MVAGTDKINKHPVALPRISVTALWAMWVGAVCLCVYLTWSYRWIHVMLVECPYSVSGLVRRPCGAPETSVRLRLRLREWRAPIKVGVCSAARPALTLVALGIALCERRTTERFCAPSWRTLGSISRGASATASREA